VLITWVPGGPNPLWRSLSLPVRTYPISSDHDDYEYLNGRVAILGGDGTYFNTQSVCCQERVGGCGYV
jgi:hypothetical protein